MSTTSRVIRALMPERLHRAQLVVRRAPIVRQAGVIFIHIPKNAGFSVNMALYGQSMGHYTAAEFSQYCPKTWKSLPSFALTRNPWARCLSAYRFATRKSKPSNPIEPTIARPGRYLGPEFESFDSFVKEWLAAKPLASRDQVFRPQSAFITDKSGAILVDYVGRAEDMRGVENWLTGTLNRDISIKHYNRTSADPRDDYRSAYTEEAAQIVRDLYSVDVARFGYRF